MTSTVDPKIIDLLNQKKEGDLPFPSLEYFPPRSDEGVKNLYSRMDRMKETIRPLFTDVTWGAGGSTATLSMDIALQAHNTGHVANLHMTCTNMSLPSDDPSAAASPKDLIKSALQTALDGGIRNIVALRGDPAAGQDEWTAAEGGFTCALDLVHFIRAEFGNEFGISVAGYPEGHPNAISLVDDPSTMTLTEAARSSTCEGQTFTCRDEDYKKEMDYLKQKVDAGADFIITQMFFDTAVFIQFVKDCRTWGITCPVVPGLMCLNAYGGFKRMTKFCKSRVPPELEAGMEERKDDEAAIKQYGIDYGSQMCRDLMDFGVVALHFYTLNLEKVVYGILDSIGLSENATSKAIEADANSMQAVGSAWARVGDSVTSIFGRGVVTEIRADHGGAAVIRIESWELAGGQNPIAYLQNGQFQKIF
ncbi:Methylenetetrahydrofolate reductase [Fragilaria crotonensis]|nr:Methylenetetrahydrofolate reductase [Fragilaria crotonensis]